MAPNDRPDATGPSNWTPQSPSRSMRLWTELIPIEMASIKSRTRMTPNPRLVHGLLPQGLFSNARVLAKGPSVKISNTTSMRPVMMAQMIMLRMIIDLALLEYAKRCNHILPFPSCSRHMATPPSTQTALSNPRSPRNPHCCSPIPANSTNWWACHKPD